jgi:hypothetical protein
LSHNKLLIKHAIQITLLSAISSLTPPERRSLHFQVYLAQTDPSAHRLWHSPLLNVSNGIVNGLSTPISVDTSPKNLERLKNYEKDRNLNAKTALDFSFALKSCLDAAPHSKYIALIEGDVIFAEGWFAYALEALAHIESMKDGRRQKWLDIRLFHPESNTGWAERRLFGNHVPQIILFINAVVMAAVAAIRYARLRHGVHVLFTAWLSNANLAVLCVVVIPVAVVTFFGAGKASIASLFLHPGVHQQNWGCCTQTIIFPTRNIEPLIHTLQTRTEETTPDWSIMQHARREGLSRYVLNPVLIQHRGAMESVITPDRNGQGAKGLLWSVAFEDLNPKRLKREHFQIVRKLFPREFYLQEKAVPG